LMFNNFRGSSARIRLNRKSAHTVASSSYWAYHPDGLLPRCNMLCLFALKVSFGTNWFLSCISTSIVLIFLNFKNAPQHNTSTETIFYPEATQDQPVLVLYLFQCFTYIILILL
jgi:hypothetical protein